MAKSKLTNREKAVLALLPVSVAVMAGAFLLRGPLEAYRASEQQVVDAAERLKMARVIRESVLEQQRSLSAFLEDVPEIDTRPLLTIINETLNEVDLTQKEKVGIVNGTTTIRDAAASLDTVRLSLKGVSLEELINVVYLLQSRCGILIVESVPSLAPAADGQGLNAEMVLSKVRVAGGSAVAGAAAPTRRAAGGA